MTKVICKSNSKRKSLTKGDSFSFFFHSASKKEKKAVIIKAAKKANKDQRDLVRTLKPQFKNS